VLRKQWDWLDLSATRITDASVPFLAKLEQIKSLDVRQTKLTELGLAALRQALPNCKIEWDDAVGAQDKVDPALRNGVIAGHPKSDRLLRQGVSELSQTQKNLSSLSVPAAKNGKNSIALPRPWLPCARATKSRSRATDPLPCLPYAWKTRASSSAQRRVIGPCSSPAGRFRRTRPGSRSRAAP
jgi:hypothetical protein